MKRMESNEQVDWVINVLELMAIRNGKHVCLMKMPIMNSVLGNACKKRSCCEKFHVYYKISNVMTFYT